MKYLLFGIYPNKTFRVCPDLGLFLDLSFVKFCFVSFGFFYLFLCNHRKEFLFMAKIEISF